MKMCNNMGSSLCPFEVGSHVPFEKLWMGDPSCYPTSYFSFSFHTN